MMSRKYVFSTRALTIRAADSEILFDNSQVMTGVEMVDEALMISLIRGTPCVMDIPATPAKWKVFSVIWVPGSPIDCAPIAPTAWPGWTRERWYLVRQRSINVSRAD